MARQILINLGYRVLSACDDEEAVRLCEKETPALAILDVIMPKLGGAAAASKLIALFRGLPISLYERLFASFGKPSGHSGRALAAKKYRPTTLGRLVREILGQAKKRKGESSSRRPRGIEQATRPSRMLSEAEKGRVFTSLCSSFFR